jgi:hypothetical protein
MPYIGWKAAVMNTNKTRANEKRLCGKAIQSGIGPAQASGCFLACT